MTSPFKRKSTRLRGYDYSTSGLYFITICVEGRESLLGTISEEAFVPAVAGLMVESWWGNISRRFPKVELGPYVIMPNHLHGILVLESAAAASSVVEARCGLHFQGNDEEFGNPVSLNDVIGWFKSMTTTDYIRGVTEFGWPPFTKRLWQRSYYDHIIRNESDLSRIENYIESNPRRWAEDLLNVRGL